MMKRGIKVCQVRTIKTRIKINLRIKVIRSKTLTKETITKSLKTKEMTHLRTVTKRVFLLIYHVLVNIPLLMLNQNLIKNQRSNLKMTNLNQNTIVTARQTQISLIMSQRKVIFFQRAKVKILTNPLIAKINMTK